MFCRRLTSRVFLPSSALLQAPKFLGLLPQLEPLNLLQAPKFLGLLPQLELLDLACRLKGRGWVSVAQQYSVCAHTLLAIAISKPNQSEISGAPLASSLPQVHVLRDACPTLPQRWEQRYPNVGNNDTSTLGTTLAACTHACALQVPSLAVGNEVAVRA
jgi:hypothetical protein